MRCARSFVLVTLAAFPACSNDDGQGMAGSSGGAAGSSTHDAALQCLDSGQRIDVVLDPPLTEQTSELSITGAVTAAAANEFVVDSCIPGTGCASNPTKISVSAPGLSVELPVDALIQVHILRAPSASFSIGFSMSVRNVPEWNGALNPVHQHTQWYLLTNSDATQHPDAPFAIKTIPIDCPRPDQGGSGQLYDLLFEDPQTDLAVRIAQGEKVSFEMADQSWDAMHVRGFAFFLQDGNSTAWWAAMGKK